MTIHDDSFFYIHISPRNHYDRMGLLYFLSVVLKYYQLSPVSKSSKFAVFTLNVQAV